MINKENNSEEKKVCPGSLHCPEIDALGEYPFPSEFDWNIAVDKYCENCEASK